MVEFAFQSRWGLPDLVKAEFVDFIYQQRFTFSARSVTGRDALTHS